MTTTSAKLHNNGDRVEAWDNTSCEWRVGYVSTCKEDAAGHRSYKVAPTYPRKPGEEFACPPHWIREAHPPNGASVGPVNTEAMDRALEPTPKTMSLKLESSYALDDAPTESKRPTCVQCHRVLTRGLCTHEMCPLSEDGDRPRRTDVPNMPGRCMRQISPSVFCIDKAKHDGECGKRTLLLPDKRYLLNEAIKEFREAADRLADAAGVMANGR